MNRTMIAAALSMLVVGCSSGAFDGKPDPSTIGPMPPNWRQLAVAHVKATYFDPYSIRDAAIAPPFPGGTVLSHDLGSGMGWVVCFRANSKNRMGAYVGQRSVGIVLRDGKVVHTVDQGEFAGSTINSGDILCKNAQFEPIAI